LPSSRAAADLKYPVLQGTHFDVPPWLHESFLHGEHSVCDTPTPAIKVPKGHLTQNAEPSAAYVPLLHAQQSAGDVDASPGPAVRASQRVQLSSLVAPVALSHVPGEQMICWPPAPPGQ
jgi:hypothetical protein